jgi:hypothetical protein
VQQQQRQRVVWPVWMTRKYLLDRESRDIAAGLLCKRSEGKGPEAALEGCAKVVIDLGWWWWLAMQKAKGVGWDENRVKGGSFPTFSPLPVSAPANWKERLPRQSL